MGMKIWEVSDNFYYSSEPTVEGVKAAGIEAIICVSKKKTSPEVQATVEFEHWLYLHIMDGKTVEIEKFAYASGWVMGNLYAGRTTLVHCYGGRNRSALTAALVLRSLEDLTGEEALTELRKRSRPQAVMNPVFVEYLESLSKIEKGKSF